MAGIASLMSSGTAGAGGAGGLSGAMGALGSAGSNLARGFTGGAVDQAAPFGSRLMTMVGQGLGANTTAGQGAQGPMQAPQAPPIQAMPMWSQFGFKSPGG